MNAEVVLEACELVKVYRGSQHPHQAQKPETLKVGE